MSEKEPVVIVSKQDSTLCNIACKECGNILIASTEDSFCPDCGSSILDEINATNEISISSSVKEDISPCLVCATCNTTIFSDSTDDQSVLAASIYCPACGSAEVDMLDESETVDFDDDDDDDDDDGIDEIDDYDNDDDDEVEDGELDGNDAELNKNKQDSAENSEDEVINKLTDTAEIENLEAVLLTKPSSQWVVFSSGKPILKLRKETQPVESHFIFSQENFMDVFMKRTKEIGLFSTAKEFNADILDETSVINQDDIENVVYDRLQSMVLPKFLECVSLAVEGMVRNIYPDLAADLKASFYDEMKARGVKDPRDIVEASFTASGSTVFSAIIAKAMELFNKPEEIRKELRATILSTDGARTVEKHLSEDDLESTEVGAKLKAGNLIINPNSEAVTATLQKGSVEFMRTRLSLSNK